MIESYAQAVIASHGCVDVGWPLIAPHGRAPKYGGRSLTGHCTQTVVAVPRNLSPGPIKFANLIFNTILAMTTYDFEESELEKLKGKTILITGASTGIGRATALLAHSEFIECLHSSFYWVIKKALSNQSKEHGANLALGDVAVEELSALAAELKE